MKLDCAVVKDLYVLYQENELSLEVREWVDSHLKECKECSKVYQSGSSLPDIAESGRKEPSKKLDERLMMKLKLSRLRIAIAFILIIFVMVLFNLYSQSRVYLIGDFDRYCDDLSEYYGFVGSLKRNIGDDRYRYDQNARKMERKIERSRNLAIRNLNYFEKKSLDKYYNHGLTPVTTLLQTLNNRWEIGNWSEKDEAIYHMLLNEIQSLEIKVGGTANSLRNKYYIVDTKELIERYDRLHRIATTYTVYNKLPEETQFLSEMELRDRLSYILDEKPQNIKLIYGSDFSYQFEVLKGHIILYQGYIDSVTGTITTIHSNGPKEEGEIVEQDKASDTARGIALRNTGEGFDVNIQLINAGTGGRGSSNDVVWYNFKLQHTFNGYKIFNGGHISIDGRTNKPLSYTSNRSYDIEVKAEDLNTDIKYSHEEALEKAKLEISSYDRILKNIGRSAYTYIETRFIRSVFSGTYELVHMYRLNVSEIGYPEIIYINALTCEDEATAPYHSVIDEYYKD